MKQIVIDATKQKKLQKLLDDFYPKKNPYEAFSDNKKAAYAFVRAIGVKICPYCNINYISPIFDEEGTEILRPDIDHYFSKDIYPGLQLCLFNLIPSCSPCNQRLKKSIDFRAIPHLHPYFYDFDSVIRFYVDVKSANYLDETAFALKFTRKSDDALKTDSQKKANQRVASRAEENIKTFKLEERYQEHKDEVVLIFKKMKYYWRQKKLEITRLLSGDEEPSSRLAMLDAILFPEKDCDINRVSLGKLKKDIICTYL